MTTPIELAVQSMPRRRRRRVRPARFPRGIERQYVKAARDIERAKQQLVADLLIARLPELARLAGLRADAERYDQSPWRALLDVIMRDITRRYGRAEFFAREAARDAAERVSLFNRKEIIRQIRSAIGIDIFADDPDLLDALEDFETAIVSHIVTTSPQNFATIENVVSQGFRSGQRASTIADALINVMSVQESRALFWARDQIGSLNGQLTRKRQKAIGIERYVWRTSLDEAVRESHRQLEGTIHSWDDPPTVGVRQVHPGEDYNCLAGITKVVSPARVSVAYRRLYRGDLTEIVTVSGEVVHSTPNHPVLTADGVLPAHDVQVGDYLVDAGFEGVFGGEQDVENTEATIAQIFDFLSLLFPTQRVRGLASQFHGDGLVDQEIDIVRAYRGLDIEWHPDLSQDAAKAVFAATDVMLDASAPATDGYFMPVLISLGFPSDSSVRRLGKAFALGIGCLRHPDSHGAATIAWLNAASDKMSADCGPGHAVLLRQLLDALTGGEVTANELYRYLFSVVRRAVRPSNLGPSLPEFGAQVVGIDAKFVRQLGNGVSASVHEGCRVVEKRIRKDFADHVYNLETESGWYIAEGTVVGNCRCTPDPVIEGVEIEKTGPEDVPRDPELVRKKRNRDRRRRERAKRRANKETPIAL